jgi:two-component system nitrogen regulation sensor histidine kinase GlnL
MPASPSTPQLDLQRVLDSLLDGVIVLSSGGRVLEINAEACRILEVSAETAPGREIDEMVGPGHAIVSLALEVRQQRRPIVKDGVTIERRYGHDLDVELAVSPVADENGITPAEATSVVVLLRDRTIGNSLREEVSQREQLAHYGLIAAGIAHEVKNPLGGIRGTAELLESWVDSDRARKAAALIVSEVDRIHSLVEELMVFARGDQLELEALNLHLLIDNAIALAEADTLSQNVEFARVFDPSIPELMADGDRLMQVFLNLIRNGVQAMGDTGGTLTITTRMTLQHRVVGSNRRSLPTAEIVFEDEGPGISPDILDRLATPFFTTKTDGTGLGLAVSRHWVTRHGGRLYIDHRERHEHNRAHTDRDNHEDEPEYKRQDKPKGARILVDLPLKPLGE